MAEHPQEGVDYPRAWHELLAWFPDDAALVAGHPPGRVSHDQLDYYLDEFTFGFNRRRARHRGLLFYRLLEQAVATDPHPLNTLYSSAREIPGAA
jgi:hypothetical protein